jgi:phosphoribosylglycinamide formyltransferase-1
MIKKLKLAILISGRGSNMRALIEACTVPEFPAEVVLVLSNKPDAQGLEFARENNIPTKSIEKKSFASRDEFEIALDEAIRQTPANLICLAGFMMILGSDFVNKWQGQMINIHPSLLPDFKGATAQRDALESGVKETGCTVHYVVPEVDSGEIVIQKKVKILADDLLETLSKRILDQEHIAYKEAIEIIARNYI